MATMNISLRNLIRRDQERADKVAAVQRLVDEARTSGLSDETMADIRARAIGQACTFRADLSEI